MRYPALAAAGYCALLALLSSACVCAQEWKPQKNVDIVCSSGPGSSADRQARVVQKFLQSLPGMPSVSVTNRAGGGGMLALSYLVQRAGDPHYLGILSTAVVTNQITGLSKISHRDFTPLNILMRDRKSTRLNSSH